MSGAGRFLLVEDEAFVARAVARRIRQLGLGNCVVAATAEEALTFLGDGSLLHALIIDIGLPDGSGLEVLATARKEEAHALTPAIVRSGHLTQEFVVRASRLDAKYLVKNADDEWNALVEFLEDATSLKRKIALAVRALRLTPAVAEVVTRSALGESLEAIAKARGTSLKTVEHQIESAREQTGQRCFRGLVEAVLRAVARS